MISKTKVSQDSQDTAPISEELNDHQLANVAPQTLATIDLDALMDEDSQNNTGLEGVDKDSFATPFLTVLQGLSPAMETVEGARLGLLHNTVTNELFKEALVVPCAFERKFLQWAPRSEGGGFRGELSPYEVEDLRRRGEITENEKGEQIYNGNTIKDTRVHYVLLHSPLEDTWSPAIISLSSTQIKYSKRWISTMQSKKAVNKTTGLQTVQPSFAHIYRIGTQKEENQHGAWYSVNITADSKVEDPNLYLSARKFNQDFTAGLVKMAPPEPDSAEQNDRF